MATQPGNPWANDRITALVTQHVEALVGAVRKEIAREITQYFANGSAAPVAPERRARRATAKRIRPCIAPECKNPSKGPRFRYLCEQHRDAPKKDYEVWRAARKATRKATKRA